MTRRSLRAKDMRERARIELNDAKKLVRAEGRYAYRNCRQAFTHLTQASRLRGIAETLGADPDRLLAFDSDEAVVHTEYERLCHRRK